MPVKVAVRSRPLETKELSTCLEVKKDENAVILGHEKVFTFDYVFDESATNTDLYNECVSNVVDEFLSGNNATVLAYGQTGSGKTFTMGTNYHADQKLEQSKVGMIPRVLEDLFEKRSSDWQMDVSFLEIYNEVIYDILSESRQIVKMQERANVVKLNNLTTKPVSSLDEALQFLEEGSYTRTTGATAQNSNSSRSHAVFIVKLTNMLENKKKRSFKLYMVDLAGSEGVRKSKTEGQRKREGININFGLLSLGKVLTSLSNKNPGHIPYRDSVLTRMLKDSLNGASNTLMIACVNPDVLSMSDTVETLRYSSCAINIPSVCIPQTSFCKENNPLRQKLDKIPPTPAVFRTYSSFPLVSSTPLTATKAGTNNIFSPDGIVPPSVIRMIGPPIPFAKPAFALPIAPPKAKGVMQKKLKAKLGSEFSGLLSPLAKKVHAMLERSMFEKLEEMETKPRRKRSSLSTITNAEALGDAKKLKSSSKLNVTFSPIEGNSKFGSKLNETFSPQMPDNGEKENKGNQLTTAKDAAAEPLGQVNDLFSPLVRKVNNLLEVTIYPRIEKLIQKQLAAKQIERRHSPRFSNDIATCEKTGHDIARTQEENFQSYKTNLLHVINNGSPKKLKSLPAIGVKTAQTIYLNRKMNGPLKKLSELKNVVPQKQFYNKFLKANCLDACIEAE